MEPFGDEIAILAAESTGMKKRLPCVSIRDHEPSGVCHGDRIMIVDDHPVNVKVVRKYLQSHGYREFITATDSTTAFDVIRRERPDVVLLDIMMPEVCGLQILQRVRQDRELSHLPVIMVTAACEPCVKVTALELGATDFLAKPVDPNELAPRVRNALVVKAHHDHLENFSRRLKREVRRRTEQLEASRRHVVHCLARAAEFRDNETGFHVIRVGRYVGIIARELGFDEGPVELLELAAQLHDVGKIGIPDSILLKPGKLEPEQYELMKSHCRYGADIITAMPHEEWEAAQQHTDIGANIMSAPGSPIIEVAAVIARTHHEKFDGTGYPRGLAGADIPIEGRMAAVADVFDALSSKRPYKPPLPAEKCFEIIRQERGKHFDPQVLDAFLARKAEVLSVFAEYEDAE